MCFCNKYSSLYVCYDFRTIYLSQTTNNSRRIKFVMIIPDQIFLSFIISFSSTSRDEQKQTQFVSQVCGWEKIIQHEICSYQFSCRIHPQMKFIAQKNMVLLSVFEQIFLLDQKSYKQIYDKPRLTYKLVKVQQNGCSI